MNERPIRVGMAGVNFGAVVHIPGFQSEGLEVVAVCARRRETADEAAERFGIPNVFTDYDAMLKLDGLDAVSIATPEALHAPMTLAALAAGKHVICEKPFATDQASACQVLDAARGSGLTAMVGHEFRFASARMRAKELIDEGYIGNLRFVLMRLILGTPGTAGTRLAAPTAAPPAVTSSSGFLGRLGSHYVDCLRHWFGEVESVSGDLANFTVLQRDGAEAARNAADDSFLFTLHFANGGWAQMVGSRAGSFAPAPSVEIYGDAGTLVTPQRGVNPPAHGTLLGAKVGEEKVQELPIPERLQPFTDDRDDRLMPFRLLVREFVRGIHEGTSPGPNLYDGFRCQQILDAVFESSRTGRRVEIPPE